MEHYSGCNFWKNTGQKDHEPIGTATSMHQCGDCYRIEYCLVKQKSEIWKLDEKSQLKLWNQTADIEREKQSEPN